MRKIKIATNLLNDPLPPAAALASTIKRQYIHTENTDIYYPQFEQLESMLAQGVLNNQLEEAALKYSSQLGAASRIAIDYEVTRHTKGLVSVIFKGRQQGDGQQELLSSLNFDLKSRQPIVAKNLVKNDDTAHQALTTLLQQAAANNPAVTKLPVFDEWMGIYFTQSDIVFYYLETDHATNYVKIAVPLEKAAPYLNEIIELK